MTIKEFGRKVKPEKGMIVRNIFNQTGVIVGLRPIRVIGISGIIDSTYRSANPVKVKTFSGFNSSEEMESCGVLIGEWFELANVMIDTNESWGSGEYHAG